MMKLIVNDYVMTVVASKQQMWVWCVVSAVLHFVLAIVLLRLSWASVVVISLSIVSYIVTILIVFSIKRPPYKLTINERGDLRYQFQIAFVGKLLPSSFSTNWFVWLSGDMSLYGSADNKKMCLLIWRDALHDQSFRRLARIIRLKRQMI